MASLKLPITLHDYIQYVHFALQPVLLSLLGLETFSQLVYEDEYGAVSEGRYDCFWNFIHDA